MGLFSSITNIVKHVVAGPVAGIIRLTAPKKISNITSAIPAATFNLTGVGTAINTGLAVGTALTAKRPTVQQGGQPMALNVGGILGAVSGIFGGAQNPYFQGVSNVAGLASQFFPQPVNRILSPQPQAVMAAAPRMLAPMLRGGAAMIGRSFFQRFPNLAAAMQQLRDRGFAVKRAQLWSLMKRFGPELLVTGGLLTAAAVSELMMAGPGHRRMNAANGRALHRAARRIKSFHRMCGTIDLLKSRGSRRSSTRVVCGTCRKSPCRC